MRVAWIPFQAIGGTAILTPYGRSTWLPLCAALLAAAVLSFIFLPRIHLALGICVGGLFILALLFTLSFFRDPERQPEGPANAVVSPADGQVVEITEVNEPHFIGGPAHKVAIFMSVFNVHVNRAPVGGTVEWTRRQCGKFLNALGPQASIENECLLVAFRREGSGKPLLLKLIAGLIARRIVCRLQPGDTLARGQRLGMIKFGSRAEIFLPRNERFEVAVRLGQHVTAGKTVLGIWQ